MRLLAVIAALSIISTDSRMGGQRPHKKHRTSPVAMAPIPLCILLHHVQELLCQKFKTRKHKKRLQKWCSSIWRQNFDLHGFARSKHFYRHWWRSWWVFLSVYAAFKCVMFKFEPNYPPVSPSNTSPASCFPMVDQSILSAIGFHQLDSESTAPVSDEVGVATTIPDEPALTTR